MIDPLCLILYIVIIFISVTLYILWPYHDHGQKEDPILFDASDPAQLHEFKCITEQRKWGRERGPEIILINGEKENEK